MSHTQLLRELREFTSGEPSVLEAALLITRIIDPDADQDWCQERIGNLARDLGGENSATSLVQGLKQKGFSAAAEQYKPENSSLEHVLRHRKGIPISLAAVLLCICERLEVPAHGVNFPGHFLVSIEDTLIDPLNMQSVTKAECLRWLKNRNLESSGAFRPASAQIMLERMLNNLAVLAQANDDHARELELSDFKLLVTSQPFTLYVERVRLWLRLGVNGMAQHDLKIAVELAPDEAARESLQQGLANIAQRRSALH